MRELHDRSAKIGIPNLSAGLVSHWLSADFMCKAHGYIEKISLGLFSFVFLNLYRKKLRMPINVKQNDLNWNVILIEMLLFFIHIAFYPHCLHHRYHHRCCLHHSTLSITIHHHHFRSSSSLPLIIISFHHHCHSSSFPFIVIAFHHQHFLSSSSLPFIVIIAFVDIAFHQLIKSVSTKYVRSLLVNIRSWLVELHTYMALIILSVFNVSNQ